MITIADYWMGRAAAHADEVSAAVAANAAETVGRVNLLLSWAAADGVRPGLDARTGTHVASGWRPAAINDKTANAAAASRHLTGCAVDIRDNAGRELARWCLKNLEALEEIGLWMEDPQWTPTWVHLQIVPPKSGRRVYVPSDRPPLIAALPEQAHRGVA